MRRFIPNLATMFKPLTTMLKKNMVFAWTKVGKIFFEDIKAAMTSNPTLITPNFEKYFILDTLGGEPSISTILTQENDKNEEQPIAFFSKGLKEHEDKYSYVEKKALVVKEVHTSSIPQQDPCTSAPCKYQGCSPEKGY